MSKRKMTFQQQLVAFCMTANAEQIDMALDTLKAAKDVRHPKSRKPSTRTQTATKTAQAVASGSSSDS